MERGWERRGVWALALVAMVAWVVRFLPFTREGGAFGYPIDYAEGLYYSASALFFQGHWPYRDFVIVHPPGSVLLWWPATVAGSFLGADTGFTVARWLATLCGAFNVFLVGRLALRIWGPVAGLVSALVYASFPETVLIERGPFLEPLLNLACLSAANVWLVPPRVGREKTWWFVAGVLFGLAVSVKLLGGIWLFAALLSRPLSFSWDWRPQATLLLGTAAAVTLIMGPFFLQAPSEFLSQVFFFQALRPADGDLNHMGRLYELFPERRLVGLALALLGLVLVAVRAFRTSEATRTAERFFAVTYILTITAFLSSPSYWNQYNTFAASDSILAGVGAAAIHQWLRAWFAHQARLVAVLLCVAVLLPTLDSLSGGLRLKAPEQLALAHYIREKVPPDAPLFAFEPAWGLMAGRLPPSIPGAPLVVDSYALMLRSGMSSGQPLAHASETFQTSASQQAMRELLARSHFVVLGWRGERQLSEESRQWFRAHFIQRFPEQGKAGPDLWEQLPR
jgi:hypothetical protein